MQRYARQLALPEVDLLKQEKLQQTTLLMVGAGGLGAAALPYLAGAGIGHIIIIDHDYVDITNLGRQTIYKSDEQGKNKARLTQAYLKNLNPDIKVTAITDKLDKENATSLITPYNIDIILDGSDNFATKALLNDLSLTLMRPLISASVNQFGGQIGIFEGYKSDKACYRCLFPEFPTDAKNCNEAGILGTSAGIIGLYQAHVALGYLTEIKEIKEKQFQIFNLKTIQSETILITKDINCPSCKNATHQAEKPTKTNKDKNMIEMISIDTLNEQETAIIDVRQPEEITADPLKNPLIKNTPINIPLPELINRLDELPTDQRLAFICAGNIRSRQAVEYLDAKGYEDICILDKFSV